MSLDIKAIDMHTHINHGVKGDSTSLEHEVYRAELEYMLKMNEAAGIEKSFVSTFSSVTVAEMIVSENEYLCHIAAEQESIYQWVVIDPRIPETMAQADRMLRDRKCVGIKMHPAYHGYALADHYEDICTLASRHSAVLLIHPSRGDVETMIRIADEFPSVNLINPHVATKEDVDSLVLGGRNHNFWLDTSGIGSVRNAVIEYAYERCGDERILFGTDTYAAGFQRGRIEYAMIPTSSKERILRYNAEELFARSLG